VTASLDRPNLLAAFPLRSEFPLLWGDEDNFHHVNSLAYLRWCETARIEYLTRIGLYPPLPEGLGPILAGLSCQYRRPLYYPDTVIIGTRVPSIGDSSFRMEHSIVSRASGELVAEADSALVTVDYSTGRPVPVPEAVRQAIGRLEGQAVGALG
jgi:acyl-CoA thioester hydrolase